MGFFYNLNAPRFTRGRSPAGGAVIKRAVMKAGAQMDGFLSSEERPSACKRWLGCLRGAYK